MVKTIKKWKRWKCLAVKEKKNFLESHIVSPSGVLQFTVSCSLAL